jgi:predicted Zn-dependent protease
MISEALALSTGRDVTTLAALAAARAGAVTRAEGLLRELERQYPRHTVIARYWAPTIRAAVELRRGRFAEARRHLQAVSTCELASPPPVGVATLYPVYLRGEALLGLGDGAAAALEFQKVVGHPGLVLNFPLHALSQLQLARAWAMSGDHQSSRRAYDAFLALWKDADAGEPVLREARTERRRVR